MRMTDRDFKDVDLLACLARDLNRVQGEIDTRNGA